jgi:S1-C subfamily serine protease
MKLSLIALALSCLTGCGAERVILSLASDQQWTAEPRPKVRVAKPPRSNPTSVHYNAPELALPPWNVPLPRPSRVLRYALPPPQLFKTASPAVYAVLGQSTGHATSQGSAVAVSSKEAITNCHVVARARTITLANATGSPAGLINTLGQGLLSGLRRSEEDIEYIQITAPVSPGSSGGGVFDDRGNLIGITTFTIRDAQNLNFAIAASHFCGDCNTKEYPRFHLEKSNQSSVKSALYGSV